MTYDDTDVKLHVAWFCQQITKDYHSLKNKLGPVYAVIRSSIRPTVHDLHGFEVLRASGMPPPMRRLARTQTSHQVIKLAIS
ncbi:jg6119 [Pararge aegeria aegeria]|uniref:Jg6119 protein n=1 Tax=Pararge aegeria aegeria TaxID=348720 RepID=A0A8S4RC99_9NEOP|nr:jg6119 [Pararge aegeria aegeria]